MLPQTHNMPWYDGSTYCAHAKACFNMVLLFVVSRLNTKNYLQATFAIELQ